MKMEPECLVCFMRQAMLTAEKVTNQSEMIIETMLGVSNMLSSIPKDITPAEGSSMVAHASATNLGSLDPFREEKSRYNALALKAYPFLRAYIDQSGDPLFAAVRVAALGNALDLSVIKGLEIEDLLKAVPKTTLAIDDMDKLRQDIASSKRILYLGDNAGEIIFDRALIETLPPGRVTFAVKSGPVFNDITREDFVQSGLVGVAEIVETGSNFAGAPLNRCSAEFLDHFWSADVIISKGQANFETLDNVDTNIYFLLKVKCGCVARELDVEIGDSVLWKGVVV
jgi:uncharacterized protein with ATP-grasp and redox domains